MPMSSRVVAASLSAVVLAVAACGEDSEPAAEPQTTPTEATEVATAPPESVETEPAETQATEPPEDESAGEDPVQAQRRFFEAMDNDAIALDDAIARALDGEAGAARQIARIRGRVLRRVNRNLLDGGEQSIGGNLLLSAATTARTAARNQDLARLADARQDITEARDKLAEELLGS